MDYYWGWGGVGGGRGVEGSCLGLEGGEEGFFGEVGLVGKNGVGGDLEGVDGY